MLLARRVLETPSGVTAMARPKRLLVPTDFSATSNIAFSYALDMAVRDGANIHVLHVIDDTKFAAVYPDAVMVEMPGLRERLTADAQKGLEEAIKTCAARNVTATTRVTFGPPASCITAEATGLGSDMIVMGTHGRSGFTHLMLGSVAERVLRTAPCPVLTVRDSSRAADTIAEEAVRWRQMAGA
jgi:nucleotide-binding universal stress UspA family protein